MVLETGIKRRMIEIQDNVRQCEPQLGDDRVELEHGMKEFLRQGMDVLDVLDLHFTCRKC